jgi:hypothetical protein
MLRFRAPVGDRIVRFRAPVGDRIVRFRAPVGDRISSDSIHPIEREPAQGEPGSFWLDFRCADPQAAAEFFDRAFPMVDCCLRRLLPFDDVAFDLLAVEAMRATIDRLYHDLSTARPATPSGRQELLVVCANAAARRVAMAELRFRARGKSKLKASTSARLTRPRVGVFALTSREDAEALKQQVLGVLRRAVATAPKRLHQRRRARERCLLGLVVGSFAVAGLLAGHALSDREPTLRVEPFSDAQVVWSDAVTELRRLTGTDDLPARGTLSAEGPSGARVLTAAGLQFELEGRTRVTLDGLRGGGEPPSLSLDSGIVHCRVPVLRGGDTLSVYSGGMQIDAKDGQFSVSRVRNDADRSCVRIERGSVEIQHQGQRHWLRPGQSFGCGSNAAPGQ